MGRNIVSYSRVCNVHRFNSFKHFGRIDGALSAQLDWALPPDLVRAWGDANAQSAAVYKNDVKLAR